MRTWFIYIVRDRKPVYLGTVEANHHPNAIKAAAEKWPEHLDVNAVVGGFVARTEKFPESDRGA